jgi:hypothetical protein
MARELVFAPGAPQLPPGGLSATGTPPPTAASSDAFHPAGDEPLESGAGTLRAACPTLGRQERRITGRAERPPCLRSAERSRLDHHRGRRGRRHHLATFTARPAGRATRRLLHRHTAGGLAGLRRRTGCCSSRAGRAELHKRWATAAVRTTETTAAAGSRSEAAEDDHEAQGTAHGWHLHHRRVGDSPRSDTMRRPRRRLQTVAHNPAPCRTSDGISQKNSHVQRPRDADPAVRARP